MEKITTTPIEKEWYARLKKSGYTADSVFPDYNAEELKAKLLAVGGEAVCFPGRLPKHKTLLNKGVFTLGADAKLWKLKQSQCHSNVEWILEKYTHFKNYFGFALSSDGVWRLHSVAYDTVRNCLLETTESRLVYYVIKF